MGTGNDSCKDEELHLASPGGRRAIPLLGMDPERPSTPCSFVALREDKDPRAVVKEDEALTGRKAPQGERVDQKSKRA